MESFQDSVIDALNAEEDSLSHSAIFNVEWELPRFMRLHFDDGPGLGSVLTVTGQAVDAYATTCSNYCNERWEQTSQALLTVLEAILSNHGHSNDMPSASRDEFGSMKVIKSPSLQNDAVAIQATGSKKFLVQIAQQLGWLTASFRSSTDGLTLSEVNICSRREGSQRYFDITTMGLRELQEKSCWHLLYRNCVIACGFPIPHRDADERGLQTDYATMKDLAGIFFPVQYRKRLLLRGFSTLLIPTRFSSAHKSIQWHLILKEDGRKIELSEAQTVGKHPVVLEIVNGIETSKAFIGYCSTNTADL